MGVFVGLLFGISIWLFLTVSAVISFWRRIRQGTETRWGGIAPVSTRSHIAILAFLLFLGLAFLFHSALAGVAGFTVGIVMCYFGICDERRYRNRLKQTRASNAAQYPGVFEQPAPAIAASELPDQPTFRIFDNFTATYLGEITREQLLFLIRWHENFGTGAAREFPQTNDIFILVDCLDMMRDQGADPALIELLRQWISKKKNDLELRWTID
ncbi:MAG: hypothetical protein JXB10_10850 [Pirellulales bacterium]|nr:hypothetical protein [Pirellulales bacterium]